MQKHKQGIAAFSKERRIQRENCVNVSGFGKKSPVENRNANVGVVKNHGV